MPLSEDEQRILQQIEQQFYEQDPDLAGEMGRPSVHARQLTLMRWSAVTFVLGLAILLVALAWEHAFVVALAGFFVMLGSALWFERCLDRMGRAGLEHLTRSLRDRGLGDGLRGATERARERLRRTED
jgi:chromate transport protein ChrA